VGTAGKLCVLGGASLPIYVVSFRWDHLLPPPPWAPGWYQVEISLLFLPYLVALSMVWRSTGSSPSALRALFLFALLFRLPLLPTEPHISTDMYRYLWDGRVQAAGINPYRYAPDAEALRFLRDEAIYHWINRKEFPTIYPAGAQLIFWGAAECGMTTPARFKALLVMADLWALWLLTCLLDHYRINRLRALLYAWNPLIVYESAHAGHVDTLMVLCVLATLLAFVRRRVNLAFLSLALATSLKLYPALLAAVLARGKVVQCVLIFLVVLLCVYVPYFGVGEKVIGFLPRFLSDPDEIMNLGLPSLLFAVLPPAQAGWVFRFGVLAVVVWIFFRPEAVAAEGDALESIGAGLRPAPTTRLLHLVYLLVSVHTLLLYPVLYPWYLSWLIPLLCFFPSPGWLYFSWASAFVYVPWPTPTWVLWLEYAPLYVLLGREVAKQYRST
jgi:alpha-1,6-mannosyltransferase